MSVEARIAWAKAHPADVALQIAEMNAKKRRTYVLHELERAVGEIERDRPTPVRGRALRAFQQALIAYRRNPAPSAGGRGT